MSCAIGSRSSNSFMTYDNNRVMIDNNRKPISKWNISEEDFIWRNSQTYNYPHILKTSIKVKLLVSESSEWISSKFLLQLSENSRPRVGPRAGQVNPPVSVVRLLYHLVVWEIVDYEHRSPQCPLRYRICWN